MSDATTQALPVQVDTDLCVGSGDCARLAPTAFEVDDDGFAVVLEGARTTDRARLESAVRECPTGAISFVAEGTSEATSAGEAGPDGLP